MDSQYQEFYFPSAELVQMLNENDWKTNHKEPPWLGFIHENKPYMLEEIPRSDLESVEFERKEKITNPYLKRAFELKKLQSGLETLEQVYHGTVDHNINSIAENNFNWRFAGRSTGFNLGKGVYFSRDIDFAKGFCRGRCKPIISAKILYSKCDIGYTADKLPPYGYDTLQSRDGKALAKFEDSDFLPLYTYHFN